MSTVSSHPMDGLAVRPLQFKVAELPVEDVVWSRTCPEFAVFINALGLHVPYFERYLITSMRKAKEHIDDPKLLKDMSAIIGQEAHHAKNFLHFNESMARRYPKAKALDEAAKHDFAARASSDSLKQLVGFTSGYETFTFLAGMIVLDNYERWFADSHPVMKAIWVWHQVEEVEHGAVAFEVYQKLYGSHEWFRKWMVLKALIHIAAETTKAYAHMAKVEGWLRNPFSAVTKMSFNFLMLWRLLWAALPVFRRSYHPRLHPLVTNKQNKIQVGWRRFFGKGGDVLEIDRAKMAEILRVDLA
jgi:predicted metal-dependent hydrolase